jgi:hypothetical protein
MYVDSYFIENKVAKSHFCKVYREDYFFFFPPGARKQEVSSITSCIHKWPTNKTLYDEQYDLRVSVVSLPY